MVQYYNRLQELQSGIQGIIGIQQEQLTVAIADYETLIDQLSRDVPQLHITLDKHYADLKQILQKAEDGKIELAYLSLLISMGSLSAFLNTVWNLRSAA